MRWNINLFPLDPFLELLPVLDWHDSRNDRYSDSSSSNSLDPIEKDIDIVE
jgi:hypothetical protein